MSSKDLPVLDATLTRPLQMTSIIPFEMPLPDLISAPPDTLIINLGGFKFQQCFPNMSLIILSISVLCDTRIYFLFKNIIVQSKISRFNRLLAAFLYLRCFGLIIAEEYITKSVGQTIVFRNCIIVGVPFFKRILYWIFFRLFRMFLIFSTTKTTLFFNNSQL